jgi:hypothetical protein
MKEPSMSYNTQAALAVDSDLRNRVAACAATQGVPSPVQWADAHLWALSGSPGWDAAYAYAVAAGKPRPGYEESAVTDAMILAAVQPMVTEHLDGP